MTDISSVERLHYVQTAAPGKSWLSRMLTGLAKGYDAYGKRVGRYDRIRRLQSMTDEELAKLGITRDRIPYHVFSDLFYL